MTQQIQSTELPVAFYEQLDIIVKNDKNVRDAFHKAVEIAPTIFKVAYLELQT